MPIATASRVPACPLTIVSPTGPVPVPSDEFFAGRLVALFAVPGAFTPTCDARHLPEYRDQAAALRERGVAAIACLSVNDPFVMAAWARAQGMALGSGDPADHGIVMLADGSAQFARALGLTLDLTARGMGVRSQRFAMLVRDGVVRHLGVEEPGGFEASRAARLVAVLDGWAEHGTGPDAA